MNKNIKYLIEDIVNFNPVDYQEDGDIIINDGTIHNIIKKVPKTKEELKCLIIDRMLKTTTDTLDLSDIDTSYITSMSYLFNMLRGKNNIHRIIFDGWDTSNVTNMESMFSHCKSLKELDLSNFNTKNVKDMSNMFACCTELSYIDLSSFTGENTVHLSYMFSKCLSLENIDMSNFAIEQINCSIDSMFRDCRNLKHIKMFELPEGFYGAVSHMFKGVSRNVYERDVEPTNSEFSKYYFSITG